LPKNKALEKKKFGLIGAAGYIAPRHMKAIKETGNEMISALDPNDSVGIIDSYYPDADFFTEPERFDRHLDKLKRSGESKIDYVSICSPNYLHDAHIRMALRNEADAICEKPVVLNPWNIEALCQLEKESGLHIYTILQLRLHPAIIELKNKVIRNVSGKKYDIELRYITSRGKWYHFSWKGDIQKSGGVATNIGIHFFDMLTWIFGDVQENKIEIAAKDKASGFLELKNARVKWFLSLDYQDIPEADKLEGLRTHRTLKINDDLFNFSEGFTDLHTLSYEEILKGNGFRVSEAMKSVEIVHRIREISK
jgi:UDP-N-acetyl-2-amino-2-deoxyglucuronate dehydrogenase